MITCDAIRGFNDGINPSVAPSYIYAVAMRSEKPRERASSLPITGTGLPREFTFGINRDGIDAAYSFFPMKQLQLRYHTRSSCYSSNSTMRIHSKCQYVNVTLQINRGTSEA